MITSITIRRAFLAMHVSRHVCAVIDIVILYSTQYITIFMIAYPRTILTPDNSTNPISTSEYKYYLYIIYQLSVISDINSQVSLLNCYQDKECLPLIQLRWLGLQQT